MRVAAIALVGVLVLAGCSGGPTATPAVSDAPTDAPTAAPTPAPTNDEAATAAPPAADESAPTSAPGADEHDPTASPRAATTDPIPSPTPDMDDRPTPTASPANDGAAPASGGPSGSASSSEPATSPQPEPNASELEYPWRDRDLAVYLDVETAREHGIDRAEARTQVRHAVEYYAAGKGRVKPSDVTVRTTTDESAADITVRFTDSIDGEDVPSIGYAYGYSTDSDPALEYWSDYVVTLETTDEAVIGWHTGLWLGHALGAETVESLSAPFRDADYDDARSEWWT